MIAILDNIRSMHNVGAVFRTSDGVGIEKIYLCGYTPTPTHEKLGHIRPQVAKVALGAEEWIAWEKRANAWRLLDELKKEGHTIIALEQSERSVPLESVRLTKAQWKKSALVVGHELEGLSPGILKRADIIAEIPMAGKKNSLNVSVAFGIAAYTLFFNRRG
ncbi:MAG: RNA methyltransferase [Candidatus Spechtbacterales bacterium]